jgi:PIN domain nuclease of toxin-antitoxin system
VTRVVADTHALVWFFAGDLRRLGRRARRVLRTADGIGLEIVVSVVSLWEIALLHDERRLVLSRGFTAWCDALDGHQGFRIEPLTRADVEAARTVAQLRDPHDRLIAGTAIRLGVALLTVDQRIAASGRVKVLWD